MPAEEANVDEELDAVFEDFHESNIQDDDLFDPDESVTNSPHKSFRQELRDVLDRRRSERSPVRSPIRSPVRTRVVPRRSHPLPRQYYYSRSAFNINFKDVFKRLVKYLLEGLAVAFVAYYFIARGKLNAKDIFYLAVAAALSFAILDTFAPTVALGMRFGAGFGIGQGLFGLNPMAIRPLGTPIA